MQQATRSQTHALRTQPRTSTSISEKENAPYVLQLDTIAATSRTSHTAAKATMSTALKGSALPLIPEDCASQMSEASITTSRQSSVSAHDTTRDALSTSTEEHSPAKDALANENNVQVHVRVRPLGSRESEAMRCCVIADSKTNSISLQSRDSRLEQKAFTFDSVIPIDASQDQVFKSTAKAIVDACMCGYNGTIFAYGQTGSGKTYTIQGPSDSTPAKTESRGILPRAMEYIFSIISRKQRKSEGRIQFLCKASFMEIYNETVTDLLDPTSGGLLLREDLKKGVYVENLSEEVITSPEDAIRLLEIGYRNRHVGLTAMNHESSRSHSVFTVVIESKEERPDGIINLRYSRLNIVDLAGSERQKHTEASGIRLKEAGNINKSLSALGNVINALVDLADGKSRHIHYRDSKLTFYLKDSLGGNSKTSIIATVSPNEMQYMETLSTLKFAQRAKMIKNKAVVNEDMSGNVKSLQNEIRNLREELLLTKNQLSRFQRVGYQSPLKISRDRLLQHPRYTKPEEDGDICYDNADIAAQARIRELEDLLKQALDHEDSVEEEKSSLLDKLEGMKEILERKDKTIQSLKFVNKLREDRIMRLELNRESCDYDASRELMEEIHALKIQVQNHPDALRFASENLELREIIRSLQELQDESAAEKIMQLRAYVGNLTSQVKKLLTETKSLREKVAKPTTGASRRLSAAYSPDRRSVSGSEADIHRIQLQYEEQIEELRSELHRAKEASEAQALSFRHRIQELEADLAAANRAVQEKESSLNAMVSEHAKEWMAENQSLHQVLLHFEQQVETLSREKCALTEVIAEKDRIVFEASSKMDQMTLTMSCLKTELDEYKVVSSSVLETLEAKNAALEADIGLQKQHFESLLDDLEKKNRDLEDKLEKSESEAMRLEQDLATITDRLDVAFDEIGTRKDQLERVAEEMQALAVENEKLKSSYQSLECDKQAISEKLKFVQDEYSRHMESIRSKCGANGGIDQYIDVLISDKQKLSDTIAFLEFQAKVTQDSFSKTRGELAQAVIAIEKAAKKEKDMQTVLASLQDKVTKMRQQDSKKDSEIAGLKEELQMYKQSADEASVDRQRLLSSIETLQREHRHLQSKCFKAEAPQESELDYIVKQIASEQQRLVYIRQTGITEQDWYSLTKRLDEQLRFLRDESNSGQETQYVVAQGSFYEQVDYYLNELERVKVSLEGQSSAHIAPRLDNPLMDDARSLLRLSHGEEL